MVKLKREVSASLFRCTHRNSIARSVPDISRMFPDYPGSFLIVITFSVSTILAWQEGRAMPQIFYAAAGPQVRPTPFFLPCKKPEPFRNPGSGCFC